VIGRADDIAARIDALMEVAEAGAEVVSLRNGGPAQRAEMHVAIDRLAAALARLNGGALPAGESVVKGGCGENGL
jgi:hypothetical protein